MSTTSTATVIALEAPVEIDESAASGMPHWYVRPYQSPGERRSQAADVNVPDGGSSLTEVPIDLDKILGQNLRDQERVRTWFTFGLLTVFVVVILFALIAAMTPEWTSVKDALLIVLPAITGVLGSTVAFYYLTVFGAGTRR